MRGAILQITDVLFIDLFKKGASKTYEVIDNALPPDARIVTVRYQGNGVVEVVLESEAFEDVDGTSLPVLDPPVIRILEVF